MHLRLSRRPRLRRWATRAVALLLLPTSLLTIAAPEAHAATTPWNFTTIVTGQAFISAGTIGSAVATCPSGYFPVGGGFSNYYDDNFQLVSEYRDLQDWRVTVRAISSTTLYVQGNCVLQSSLNLQYVSDTFYRNATTGLGGGTVRCPTGWEAITGGMEWSGAGATRRVDLSSPTSDGGGWFAAGYSPDAGAGLYVEAWCASAADLGVSAPMVSQQDKTTNSYVDLDQVCPAGTRQLGGGAYLSAAGYDYPNAALYRGRIYYSLPIKPDTWRSTTYVNTSPNGSARVTNVVWCVPAAIPQVSFSQAPASAPTPNASRTATFYLSASNPAGEPMTSTCQLDYQGPFTACPLNAQFSYTNLTDGDHTLRVQVDSPSGSVYPTYYWRVDATAPTVYPPPKENSVSGPLSFEFSERVLNVTPATFQVRVAGASPLVPGSLALSTNASNHTVATWTPSGPLIPGESYATSMTSAITDLPGNALAATTFSSRTFLAVQNNSPALREYWDRDTSTSASGGGFSVSGMPGASATWRVAATSGQTAAFFGTRAADGGYGELWVDGVKKATMSFYAPSTAFKVKLYTTPALSAGVHTIQIKVLGTKPAASSGRSVAVDSLTIGSTVLQETSAVQAFQRISTASADGGSYDVVSYRSYADTGGGPSWGLTFKGTGVRLYTTKTATSGSAKIYIDNVYKTTVSLRSASTLYKQLTYSAAGLSNARHTVRILPVGTSSGSYATVAVDYLNVVAPALP